MTFEPTSRLSCQIAVTEEIDGLDGPHPAAADLTARGRRPDHLEPPFPTLYHLPQAAIQRRHWEDAMTRTLALLAVIAACTLIPVFCPASAAGQRRHARGSSRSRSGPSRCPATGCSARSSGIAVDRNDHIWIVHRPATLLDDEKGAQKNPPETKCCTAAPPVLKFDTDGNLLASWGGPGPGTTWIKNEHGLHVDREGNVWVGGNNEGDQILEFTPDGKFLRQIGRDDGTKGSNSTTRLGRPAHMLTDDAANEIYVADGYGNRRVIVFDATTGAYKRHWGAGGTKTPHDDKLPAYTPTAAPSPSFNNPVHCVRISNDGLVYVCDRAQRSHPGVPQGRHAS